MNNTQNFMTNVNIAYMLLAIGVLLLVGLVTLFDKKNPRRLTK